MKKKVFFILTILLVSSLCLITSVEETVVTKATSCLNDKINSQGCNSLSTEEKIFSLLSVGECKEELLKDSTLNKCWPSSDCSLKTTAQAILALEKSGVKTDNAKEWLIAQTTNFFALNWFLQIESTSGATTCTIEYDGGSHTFEINEDKTLSDNAGDCLDISEDEYWFEVSPWCYEKEFQISCEDSFWTSLFYQKDKLPKKYISEGINSAASGGVTKEIVFSSCFKEGDTCNYEGTLWATLILSQYSSSSKLNISSYLPYLISMKEENKEYLPESFLYTLTGGYKNELLLMQQENSWWDISGDKFYDTAISLIPFQNIDIPEKESTKKWLAEIQDDNGCWQGNLRNTALLLYSLWSRNTPVSYSNTEKDCENSGYFCMPNSECTSLGGEILSDYGGCFYDTDICCDKEEQLLTCGELGGQLCASDEECNGGEVKDSSDSLLGTTCCVGGSCNARQIESSEEECVSYGGSCKSSCDDGEELSTYDCVTGVCCIPNDSDYLWLIILLSILIILSSVGFIFKKQIKNFILKIKTKFKKFKKKTNSISKGSTTFPQTPSSKVYPGAVTRTIIPSNVLRFPVKAPARKQSDFDDILKKLKEIGK
jgi:hypothetical protein